jgi:putative methionine-R-sulfoxide reductase with GAF domain
MTQPAVPSSEPSPESFLAEITALLEKEGPSEAALLALLDHVLARFHCVVGSIHDLDPATGMLRLRAQRGIPPALLDRVTMIPIGKGMAGLAAERREPVQVCNLQSDASGMAKPAARETRMEGSLTVPMLVGDDLRGTLGIARPQVHEFTGEETRLLVEIGRTIGKRLGPQPP